MELSEDRDERRAFILKRLKARLPAMEAELHWAAGKPVPAGFIAPPLWVAGAIKVVLTESTVIGELSALSENPSPRVQGMSEAMLNTVGAALKNPREDERAEEQGDARLRELREIFVEWYDTKVAAIGRMDLNAKPPKPANSREMEDYYAGGAEAARYIADELAANMSFSGDLCFWMWLLWPDVAAVRTQNELYAWLTGMKLVSCSFKLAEKIFRRIGFLSDRAGS